MSGTRSLEFEPFVLDFGNCTLSRNGQRIALRPKTYALLEHLVAHAGQIVTKQQLLDAIWPDVSVSDTVLKVCVRELRVALEDDPRRPTFIETRHRVGYVFIAPTRVPEGRLVWEEAVGEDPVREQPVPGQPSLVGRERELGALREALALVRRGDRGPRVVFVSGEAGLGKSALVEGFAREVTSVEPDLAWCSGICVEQHAAGEALFAFLEGLSALAAAEGDIHERLRALAPSWCLQIPEMFSGDDQLADDALGATRPRMLRELRSWLAALPGERSLLWILEDMHWADPSSVDLLQYLGNACRHERVLFVVTFRPSVVAGRAHPLNGCLLELTARDRSRHLALEPLTHAHVEAYIDHALGPHAIEKRWCERIAERTEGHPLFLTSLVQHLQATGGFVRGDDGLMRAHLDPDELVRTVPKNVDAMVAQKISTLDAESRRVLACAAVQGIEFCSDVLAATLREEAVAVEDRLDEICRVDRLLLPPVESDRAPALEYRFSHALYRDALYAGVAPTRRAALHLAVAQDLSLRASPGELEAMAATLARHFELGGASAKALEHCGVVVGTAERRLALAEAEAACTQAFRLIERLPESERAPWAMQFHERRASLHIAAGRFSEATDDLAAMGAWARTAGDAGVEIEALMHTFRQLGYLGRFQEAGEVAAAAAELAEAHGLSAARSKIAASVAALCGVRGELAPACEGLASAFERLACVGAQPNAAIVLDYGAFQSMRGCHAEAAPALDRALAMARESGDALRVGAGLFWQAHSLANRGRMAPAFAALDRAIRLAERNDDAFVLPRLVALASWIRRELGAFEEALVWDERALKNEEGILPDSRAHALLGAASTQIALARLDEADALIARVVELLRRPFFGDWLIRVRLEGVRTGRALAAGDLESAARSAEELARRAAAHDLGKQRARGHLLSAEIHLGRGDFDAGARDLGELAGLVRQRPLALIAWRGWALRARLADARGDEPAARAARDAGAQAASAVADGAPETLRGPFGLLVQSFGLG